MPESPGSCASLGRRPRGHVEVHVVAGCFVSGIEPDGREIVERVSNRQSAMFWGHYRIAEDGRHRWIADYDDRESALAAAKLDAGTQPIYVEDNGILSRVSLEV